MLVSNENLQKQNEYDLTTCTQTTNKNWHKNGAYIFKHSHVVISRFLISNIIDYGFLSFFEKLSISTDFNQTPHVFI